MEADFNFGKISHHKKSENEESKLEFDGITSKIKLNIDELSLITKELLKPALVFGAKVLLSYIVKKTGSVSCDAKDVNGIECDNK